LLIAAHPDDELLGCGATASRLAAEGNDLHIAILGEGISSRYPRREDTDKGLIKELRGKAEKVGKLLGARELFFFDLPDNRFDTIPLLDVVKKTEDLISKIKPEIIFTHAASDLNIDHEITHRAVLTATRPLKGPAAVREIYAFEIPSSTEWAFNQFGHFKPQVFFDVKDTIEIKIKALGIYESEVREFPHPRSAEAVRAIARRWGSTAGLEYAEVFETVRRIL
jgi:LmbE family N-acetylglucosaminyl deacetylase